MDEIQNCIADAQYGEALRGMDNIQPSERFPKPSNDFDYESFARNNKLTCRSAISEPLGLYLIGEEFESHKVLCDFLRAVLDIRETVDLEPADVNRILTDTNLELPEKYHGDVRAMHEDLRNLKAGNESTDDDFHNLFDRIVPKLEKDIESLWPRFTQSERYKRYIQLKWYEMGRIDIRSFTVFRDLGRGAFGVVSGARLNTTGALVAIKCMNRRLVKGKKALKLVEAERNILATLGERPSDFTVWLKYSFTDKDMFYLCLPLCTGGDLGFHLQQDRYFSRRRAMFHAAEIALGLQHLHSLGVLYRDLKPENVLLDDEGHARISDMGLAIYTGGKPIKGRAGTPGYWAPEMIQKHRYGAAVDWWSFGCCLYEFLAGRCPFSKQNSKMERDEATLKWPLSFPEYLGNNEHSPKFPEVAKDIIAKFLVRDPKQRLGAGRRGVEDIRNHPFFAEIDWNKLKKSQLEPPWKPRKDMINAGNQSDIDEKNNEYDYRKLKLAEEDDIPRFEYVSHHANQVEIIHVLELEKSGQLDYLDRNSTVGCCTVS